MRRAIVIFCCFALFLPISALATVSGEQGLTTSVVSSAPTRTVVQNELNTTLIRERLSDPQTALNLADGFGTFIAIAGHGQPRATVLHFELGEAVQTETALLPYDIASTGADLALLSEPMIWHDLRLVSLNFRPLMQDAQGILRMVSSVSVEIATAGNGINEINDPTSLSSAFYPLYRQFVSNLDDLYPEISLRKPGRFLIIGSQSRLTAVMNTDQWRQWYDLKVRKGYTMQVNNMASPTSEANVHLFLQQTYADTLQSDLEYCMILGDYGDIPSILRPNPEHSSENSVGDNLYFTLAGSDLLPDVLHGRLSGLSTSEYAAYLNKDYRYEIDPYTADMSWYDAGLFTAGNFSDGSSTYPVTPVWNAIWALTTMQRAGILTRLDSCFFRDPRDLPGACTSYISNSFERGDCFAVYRGWASQQQWQYPIYGNTQLDALQTARRHPAVFAVVCGSADFHFPNGPCMGEKFTTGMGTVGDPEGAITYFGASDLHTNTRHNNAILAGIVDALVAQGIRSGAALQMAGKLEGWRQFPLEQAGGENAPAFYYILHVFNFLGDPETPLDIGRPSVLTLTHNALTAGDNYLPLTVTANGQPVDNIVVSLRKRNAAAISVALTNSAGQVLLPTHYAVGDTLQLCAWKARYFMKWEEFVVTGAAFDPRIEAVRWNSLVGDTIPNPGEEINFAITVRNMGTSATNLTVMAAGIDSELTVTSATSILGALAVGESREAPNLGLLIGNLSDGQRPRLAITIRDGANSVVRTVEVPVRAPDPVITTLTVTGDNNGNGILEAGESGNISIAINNTGGQDAQNLTAILSSWDNAITIPSTQMTWVSVPRRHIVASGNTVHVQVPSGVTPGRQVLLRLEFHHNNRIVARKNYLLSTGIVTKNSPTGPDAYGYYAYENIDAGFAATPTYNWVELDPAHGGTGDAHGVRDDSYFKMALPQPFRYYGQLYDSIWVCSNGWFSFEHTILPEFRNWELPSPMGAPSLVAPFWDDLIGDRFTPNDDTLYNCFTRFEAAGQSRFIIMWRAVLRAGLSQNQGEMDTANVTFEAVLEYPQDNSRDGSILFQYNQITQLDNDQMNGNYATVGMEDSDHHRGLNLTYANAYPASIDTLRPGRAIRITTTPPDGFLAANEPPLTMPKQFMLHDAYPNPFNPSTELSFDLPKSGPMELIVYDMLGRQVATLMKDFRAAGSYRLTFDASRLPTGIYFARLSAGSNTMVRKLMLVK